LTSRREQHMSIENEQTLQQEDGSIEETTKDQYLTFEIDNEEYAVGIAYVKEIITMVPITKVPDTPDYVEGIINVRGDITPVINVRKRFLKESKPFDELSCIVFVVYKGYYLGLIADSVKEVIFIYEDAIVPPPSAKLSYHNQFVKSIGKSGAKVKLMLDLDRFLLAD